MSEDQNIPPENLKEGAKDENLPFPEDKEAPIPVQPVPDQGSPKELQNETNMEVHHHSHSHGKKNWKTYFWEFLMLFLAVFCGFLAEYLLEHKIEKEKGKQFVKSFYQDLVTDTARISSYSNFDNEKLNSLSNLGNCYDILSKNSRETSCLLDVMKSSAINRPFKMTERTINQLSNAGGFRLLHQDDADSIIAYQKEFNDFQDFQSTVFQEAQDNVRASFNQLVNFKANAQMFKPQGARIVADFDNKEITVPLLFADDKASLNKYFNELQLYYRVIYNHRGALLDLKAKQIGLINYFKSKYHFD